MSNVKVELNRAHLAARFERGKDAAGRVLAQQIIDDSTPYVPYAEGTLSDSARAEQAGGSWAATWNAVYAAYQWYGCWPDGTHMVRNHTRVPHPKATTQWAEAAKAVHGSKWETVARREFKKGAGC